VASASRADARAAVDAAAKAYPAWAESTPAERARLFLKASEIVRRRRDEIAEILARETGSTISFSTFQMDLVATTLQQVVGWVYLSKGEVLETNQPGSHSIGLRRPLGVCASFTPWNGANILSWRAVISPVAAGNTVVVKPSEFAPVSAGIMLAEVAEEAGFPTGVINIVTHEPGAAGPIADEFFDRPEVRVINLIGGVKTAALRASYDYIVIGSGAAGSILAAELSASNAQVLIVESGGLDDAPTIMNPSVWFYNVGGPLDYHLPLAPLPQLNNRKFNMALGHVLGGGTSINAMVWARGMQRDYDGWAQNGAEGWSFKDVLPIFKSQEGWEGGANEWRGVGGPVHLRRPGNPHPTAPAFLEAARQMGMPIHDDVNGPQLPGVGDIST
jgi:Aldehyde dehydrogenase family/GMC oxidoreductase